IRDMTGRVLSASSAARAADSEPVAILDSATFQAADSTQGRRHGTDGEFPSAGGRVSLLSGGRQVGWLDGWGDGTPVAPRTRRSLTAIVPLLGMLVAA